MAGLERRELRLCFSDLGAEMLCLPGLFDCLALQRGWRGERRVGLEFMELGAQNGMLFRQVSLQVVYMGKLIGEVLRCGGV